MTNCLKKKGAFIWTNEAGKAFELIKEKLTNAPILDFPNFSVMFEEWALELYSHRKRDLLPSLVKS